MGYKFEAELTVARRADWGLATDGLKLGALALTVAPSKSSEATSAAAVIHVPTLTYLHACAALRLFAAFQLLKLFLNRLTL